MNMRLALLVLVAGLQACAPISRVTLLPQDDGRATAVQVQSAAGVVDLTQPYQTAALQRDGRLEAQQSNAEEVSKRHGAVLALPLLPPVRFTLQFEPGTSTLTPDSQNQLQGILEQATARAGGEIQVIGHTDRTGSPQANDTLSLQRAQAVRNLLIQRGFEPALVEAIGRGEREPVVPTEANVNEPRNRRAEIIIR
ncbi:OmpA family protein [Rhodoferax mekongensis]|uniref:OmpA family protein n=1 Tax=Rhodoferax mekongensis TaxID=3068341 RepID=A0ABZ0B3P5_9BURK|nr:MULTISPECIES: OmpA family protein [unclassified Rhodoferax]MDT7516148.1 OmpA family protein [Rhodoferax sp. TBRC 17199]NBX22127.1 OmpA family protein [Betaproteobacteria bacterium]WNO06538.1 OmpA family protein [Rhodoferax sp. TBRC 17307]